MNLRAEIHSYPTEHERSETEYIKKKGGKEFIYPEKANKYDTRLTASQLKIGAAEIVRAQLYANPDVEVLIQKIKGEIDRLKKQPKRNSMKFRLAQSKLERALQIQEENKKRSTALRLVSTKYEKEWTTEALEAQNPQREKEMSALSERAGDIYEQQIEQEKQELQKTRKALIQAEQKKAHIWKTWLLKARIRKLENILNNHQKLLEMKRRMDEQKKEEELELRKTG